jgi:molybdopterin molybdotransferase
MIPFEEAFDIVKNNINTLDTERVPLAEAFGRVLAENLKSDMDMPPFNKSAVDGYACKESDLENELTLIEIVPAGKYPEKRVSVGTCSKIMTGAPVPEGAEMVVMVENCSEENGIVRINTHNKKSNISIQGEDIHEGDLVLAKNTYIKPEQIAVLASIGAAEPLVYRKPKIGIISTGDELVEPESKPAKGQIRNSNAMQLFAQAIKYGAIPGYIGIAKDNAESTNEMIEEALNNYDIVLLSGGVSMGDFDFVPLSLKKQGVKLHFEKIQVQPGKPTVFGTRNKQYFFGLPGNPVSSFVQFELFVKPLIYAMQGLPFGSSSQTMEMGSNFKRKRNSRKAFIPVQINKEGKVVPVEYHGSAHIHSYIYADGITHLEIGQSEIKEGDKVNVRLL